MNKAQYPEIIRTEVREKDGYEYKYNLLLSRGMCIASFGIPLYSVSVEMKESEDGRKSKSDTQNLFSDLSKATDFFNKIVDNLATPIDLSYIVEDEFSK